MALLRTNETSYGQTMESLSKQYEALISRAETQHRDSGNKPSKQEALIYRDAAKLCEEIRDMNLSQRAVYSKWDGRAKQCMENVEAIIKYLNPNAGNPAPVAPTAGAPTSSAPVGNMPKPSAAPAAPNPAAAEGRSGAPVTTASGFTTCNAVKDVPADVIEKWYKPKPKHDFSDVTGMEKEKELLNERIKIMSMPMVTKTINLKEPKCILFYGLPGTGKTFVIEAFVSELMKKDYKFIQLKGGDIHASLVGVAEKTVQIAFQEAIDNAPCIIFIDEFDDVCINRNSPNAASHEKRLTVAFLEAFNSLKDSGKQVILLGATNYPNLVDNAMLDRIFPILVPLPDEKGRTLYFERQLKNVALDGDLTVEYMGEVSDNCSYRDLEKLTYLIQTQVMNAAIESSSVYDEDNKLDLEKTDAAATEAIEQGRVKLTKEWFDAIWNDFTPSDKKANLASLEEFERNLSKASEGA